MGNGKWEMGDERWEMGLLYLIVILFSLLATFNSFTYISLQLLLLNTLIGILASFKYNINIKYYLNLLQLIISLGFISDNIFIFYICFELLLLPIFYILFYNGQSEDNIYTSYKFIYYTLSCSLLWLASIIYFIYFSYLGKLLNISFIISLMFLLSLLVKLPLPPLHLWLNDTHTSSPVSSSILLAGTVLKLSIYGFITFYLTYFIKTLFYIKSLLISLLIIGCIYTSLACIRQSDYKRFIAYTSIGHMNISLFAILPLFNIGINGSYLLLISHGLISSSLFYHVNSIYERYNTKIISYLTGLSFIMPICSILSLLFHISNFSMPPILSWFSEYFIFTSSIINYSYSTYFISLIFIISLIYTIIIYFRIYFGKLLPYLLYSSDLSLISILLHIYFILLGLILIIFILDV